MDSEIRFVLKMKIEILKKDSSENQIEFWNKIGFELNFEFE